MNDDNINEAIRLLNAVIRDIHTHVEFQDARKKLIRAVQILAEPQQLEQK